jgi:cytochrome c oxidase cbb3-type subunit III
MNIARAVLAAAVGAALLAAVAAAQQPAPREPEEEYGEWLAAPAELATVPVNRIAKSLRLNGQAMMLGRKVFADHCAGCHGDDLKGLPVQHTPDLTDAEWRFSGDDLASGGARKRPSDVEWTVRYGIRSGNPNARGAEVSMLAFDPQYRTADDVDDFGGGWFINLDEIDDVVEYVLQISGRPADKAKAARGDVLFHDGAKGNCYDCHGEDGAGIDTFGSSNLTRPDLYLYGSDRASIRESIVKGRHGTMPAFEGVLKPEELKAVSVYVFWRAAQK